MLVSWEALSSFPFPEKKDSGCQNGRNKEKSSYWIYSDFLTVLFRWFQVFRLQVNNGIPIKSWFTDPSDCALISLLPFLEALVDADDVRPIIAKRFGNKE